MMSFQPAATMQVHDIDLAALLARNLTLGPVPVPVPAPVPVAQPASAQKTVYSISQHYHHSAHVVHPAVEEQPQPQEQPQQMEDAGQNGALAVEIILRQHGIDPASLTHVQLALFRMSTPDRRDYLLQLWRICPPTKSDEMVDEVMSLDGTAIPVPQQQQQQFQSFTTSQAADGRWVQAPTQSYMEPYMLSGYEELARREYLASGSSMADNYATPRSTAPLRAATDPVYNNRLDMSNRASWPSQHQPAAVDMENQYGALMAMRDSAMEL